MGETMDQKMRALKETNLSLTNGVKWVFTKIRPGMWAFIVLLDANSKGELTLLPPYTEKHVFSLHSVLFSR